MQQTKYLVQVVRESLLERITDFSESTLKLARNNLNRLQFANEICQRETARTALLTRITSYLYEHLKKQSGDSLTQTTKYINPIRRCIYFAALAIFRGMTPKFEPERCLSRGDYRSIIELLRQYFLVSNDIKMLWRVEQMSKNKTLKKVPAELTEPTVLAMAIRHLLETTKQYHQERVKVLNQSITCDDIQEFNSMMLVKQHKENERSSQLETNNHRTSLGFYQHHQKLSVKNINDNVELRFNSEEKRDSGWKLDTAEVRRHRNRLLSRGKPYNQDLLVLTSTNFRNGNSNYTLNSLQSTTNTRNDNTVMNCFMVKSTMTRPQSDMVNHHHSSLHFDEKQVQTDQIVGQLPKPITETLLRPKLLLRSVYRKNRKTSSMIKQPPSKQEIFTRIYDVLDVEDSIVMKTPQINENAMRMMEANIRLRNKWIQRGRLEEQARVRLKKEKTTKE